MLSFSALSNRNLRFSRLIDVGVMKMKRYRLSAIKKHGDLYLYQDGKEVEQISDMGSMSRSAPGQILSEEFFMRLDSYENLSLSPYSSDEYAQHPETIMKLEIISPDAQLTPLPHAE